MSVAEPAASALETAAAARLYERHSPRVFAFCLRMLGNREDAEDASQTTFMQAHRALQRGVVPAFETAWLLAIAKNVCLARHRAGRRRGAVELVRDPQDLAEIAAGPERENGALMGLQEALGRLPEKQRRAFLLREWQGRSYAEIGEELGVTVPAVEALIFRARRALALELGGKKRHAFDLASLLAGLKSLLGGGVAVKVAVGAAAVVGAGAVVGITAQPRDNLAPAPARAPAPAPTSPARVRRAESVPPASPATVPAGRATPGAAAPARGGGVDTPSTPGAAPAPPAVPGSPSPEPAAPASPAASPEPPPPVSSRPELPQLPDPPAIPDPLAIPPLPIELPPAPTEQLPVDVPDPPEVPDLPDLPTLP